MITISDVKISGGVPNLEDVVYSEEYVEDIKTAGAKTIFPLNVEYPKDSGNNYVAIGGVNAAGEFMSEIVLPCPPHCGEGKYNINFNTAKALVEAA